MVFYNKAIKPVSYVLAIILMSWATGCGSSDSDHYVVSFSGETISGKVADGYVSGATLTVYSSADLTEENVIGTGATDANGAFTIALSTNSVPDPIYIKSEGGTDIDLGLPAPVMLFAGSAEGSGSYNVTPLTDMVYKYIGIQGSLDASQAFLTGALGISADDLGADPVENVTAGAALPKVLASGTQGSTLSAGEYTMHLLYFERDDLDNFEARLPNLAAVTARIIALPITVRADGSIEEEFEGIDFDHDGEDDVLELSGAVIGGSLFLGIDVNDDEDDAMVMTLGGEVGLFGSLSGRCYLRSEGVFGGGFRQGVFVATFTPVGITEAQKTAMFQQLGAIMGSDEVSYLLFSDVLIGNVLVDGAYQPRISYGTVVLTQDGANGFDYSALTVNSIKYNLGGDAVEEASVWNAAVGNLDYIGASEQTRILAMRQDDTYLIIPAGGRKGISVEIDGEDFILKAGQVFLNRSDSLAPVLEAGTDYTLAQAFMGTSVLATVPRADALGQVVPGAFPVLSVPASGGKAFGSVYNADSGEIFAVSGGFLALKKDANDFFDDAGDYLTTLEMYETGALAGVRLNAGAGWVPGGGAAYQTPIGAVMYACKAGDPAPAFKGTMKFLAREFLGGAVFNEIPAWTAGKLTITIDGGAATGSGLLTIEYIDGCGYDPDDPIGGDSFGESVQNFPSIVSVQVERIGPSNSGLLHIYGTGTYSLYFIDQDPEDKDYYWDIYWPIGAPKGVYMFSYRNNEGVFTVNEIGEASITY